MCVGYWCLDDTEYSLVLCTNRDEYLSRPTGPAHWHSFETLKSPGFSSQIDPEANSNSHKVIGEGSILSGVDTLAGGTWFGINNRGDVALLTNITEPAANLPSSRGHLCSSFLCRNRSSPTIDISGFVTELTSSEVLYSGFNLLLLAPSHMSRINPSKDNPSAQATSLGKLHYDVAFLSNGGAANPIVSIPVSQQSCGCHGISNGVPNGSDPFTGVQRSSEWPKVVLGREMLSDILAKHEKEDVLVERLFGLLRNKTHSPPNTRQAFQETILVDPVDLAAVKRGLSFAHTHHQADDINPATNNHERGTRATEREGKHSSPDYYATRLSTVLLIRRTGEVLFIERDVWLSDTDAKPELAKYGAWDLRRERNFRFHIECEA